MAAAGSPPGDLLNLWDASDGRKAHLEFGFSCMGYEIPASLGVRLADPEGGEVITFIGDGTYMMNPTEIATAVQEGLKITVLISQNDGFQCIRDLQLRSSGKDFGNEFRQPLAPRTGSTATTSTLDLAANAAAFGARAFTANTAEEVEQALAAARAETRPCVIVVPTDRFARPPGSGVWWDVAPAEVSDDAGHDRRPRELRARPARPALLRLAEESDSDVGSAWGAPPTRGACGFPTIRSRRRGRATSTRSPRPATATPSSARSATCRRIPTCCAASSTAAG